MTVVVHNGYVTAAADDTAYTLITAPTNKVMVVKQIVVSNNYTAQAYFTIRVMHKSAGMFNRLVYRSTIQSNETVDLNNLFIVLYDGDYLEVLTNHAPFSFFAYACEDDPSYVAYYRSYVYSYSVDTWTDLVTAPSTDQTVVAGVEVVNFSSSATDFSLRIYTPTGYELWIEVEVPAYSYWLWRPMLGLDHDDKLQFMCHTNANLEFSAWYGVF